MIESDVQLVKMVENTILIKKPENVYRVLKLKVKVDVVKLGLRQKEKVHIVLLGKMVDLIILKMVKE